MNYKLKRYDESDFIRVRDFLSESYTKGGTNWRIERWNFAFSLASAMNEGLDQLKNSIGLFEDKNNRIISVVNSEGEMRGEVFFQLTSENRSEKLLNDMFEFAEANATLKTDEGEMLKAFIPNCDKELIKAATERGYVKTSGIDNITSIKRNVYAPKPIPDGYTFTTGDKLGPELKALAHAKAFGYIEKEIYIERAVKGFSILATMPDYKADLDVFIIDPNGKPASFASMWYDSKNHIAMLEPMGTLPGYRRLGLGSNALHEGIQRCMEQGARKVYGGDQQFYYDIGFEIEFSYGIWKKLI